MRRVSLFSLALALSALAGAEVCAETVRQRNAGAVPQLDRQLTVKRSWLDSGTVVPVGSMNRYMADSTVYNYFQPGGTWRRSEFGQEVLPTPFDLPGFLPAQPW